MGTPFQAVYNAFTSKILEDEWYTWDDITVEADMNAILESAIPYFKFPRTSLERTEEGFINDLNSIEIQILATHMKVEWLTRTILSWQNLKPLYSEQDFSQANLIDKLTKLLQETKKGARELESIYYRSVDGAPYKYRNWAGSGNG